MQSIYPYLLYHNCEDALDWLSRVFGFEEILRYTGEQGYVNHAEMRLGDAYIFMGNPGEGYRNPKEQGGETIGLYVYVDDVNAHYARAKAAGAEITEELVDQEYGDRRYTALDPTSGSSRRRFARSRRRNGERRRPERRSVAEPAGAVGHVAVLGERRVGLARGRCLGLHSGCVTQRELGARVDDVSARPRADGQDRARPVPGADEHMLRPCRAVDEVPRAQPSFLALDQQETFAAEDEEVLLVVLAVVHAGRLAGHQDADVDPELWEAHVSLEAGVGAEVPIVPGGVLRVQHEPALALGHEPGVGLPQRRLGNHPANLP